MIKNNEKQWNKQSENDICDSFNDWETHKFECLMKDRTTQYFTGTSDNPYYGAFGTHIFCDNDSYDANDIVMWREI